MAVLYGRDGRLTAQNGGFRPGQWSDSANRGFVALSEEQQAAAKTLGAWPYGDPPARLRVAASDTNASVNVGAGYSSIMWDNGLDVAAIDTS